MTLCIAKNLFMTLEHYFHTAFSFIFEQISDTGDLNQTIYPKIEWVYLCICLSVYLCICVSVYLCICVSFSLCVSRPDQWPWQKFVRQISESWLLSWCCSLTLWRGVTPGFCLYLILILIFILILADMKRRWEHGGLHIERGSQCYSSACPLPLGGTNKRALF